MALKAAGEWLADPITKREEDDYADAVADDATSPLLGDGQTETRGSCVVKCQHKCQHRPPRGTMLQSMSVVAV